MNHLFESWHYPGGEIGVRAKSYQNCLINPTNPFLFRIQNSEDLIKLLMYSNAIQNKIYQILIPYLPYARQDRIATLGDPNAVEVVAKILATTGVREFLTLDVHSEKSKIAFLNAGCLLTSISPVKYIKKYLTNIIRADRPVILISPDNGAQKKIKEYAEILNAVDIVYFQKERDPVTGKLNGLFPKSLPNPKSLPRDVSFVVIDDICDGGGTFSGIAAVIKEHFPMHALHLWTTHGIYSKGLNELLTVYQSIGSTNSFIHNLKHPRLFTLEIEGDFQ